MEERKLLDGKYLMYKDKPLVREGDTICYGDMSEKCFLVLEIMSYKKVGAEDIPDEPETEEAAPDPAPAEEQKAVDLDDI